MFATLATAAALWLPSQPDALAPVTPVVPLECVLGTSGSPNGASPVQGDRQDARQDARQGGGQDAGEQAASSLGPVSAEELRDFYARFQRVDDAWQQAESARAAWRAAWTTGTDTGTGVEAGVEAGVEEASSQGSSDGGAPQAAPDPVPDFWAEMAQFEARGYSGARLWLLEHLDRAELGEPQVERERLVRAAWLDPNLQPPFAAVSSQETIALAVFELAGRLPRKELDDWALGLLSEDTDSALRAAGLACLGASAFAAAETLARPSLDDYLEAEELFDRVLAGFGTTRAARACAEHRTGLLLERYELDRSDWWSTWASSPDDSEQALPPALSYWPRFEQLADLGQGPALWWMILHAQHRGLPDAERVELRLELMGRLIADHADAPWLAEAIRGSEALVDELSVTAVLTVGERLLAVSIEPEVRAWTRFTMASLLARDEVDEPGCERAIGLLEALAAEYPDHRLARTVPARIFALRHLRVGCQPPDQTFQLNDGEGQRLYELFDGQLLLVFWSTWDASGVDLVERLSGLQRSLPDLRILGVNVDEDIDRVRGQLGERLEFDTVWSGSPAQGWPKAWGISDLPSLFLFDTDGRIVAKPRTVAELEEWLSADIAEGEEEDSNDVEPADSPKAR